MGYNSHGITLQYYEMGWIEEDQGQYFYYVLRGKTKIYINDGFPSVADLLLDAESERITIVNELDFA